MNKEVIVFKTANDNVMKMLFAKLEESNDCKITCLIQSSNFERYQNYYNKIEFININNEGFYDLSDEIYVLLNNRYYDKVYIPCSGLRAYNFSNIIYVVQHLKYNDVIFFNCNGENHLIKKISAINNMICKSIIQITRKIYSQFKG